jgi:hypothetical protein
VISLTKNRLAYPGKPKTQHNETATEINTWNGKGGEQEWFKAKPNIFYFDGIRKLVDRLTKCTAKKGDSIEK